MTKLTITPPSTGEVNTVAEPRVTTALKEIETWANGQVGTGNITAEAITEAMLVAALQTKIAAKLSGFTLKEALVSVTAATGELIQAAKTGITVTLPAPTVNRAITVFCDPAATSVKVTTSSGSIYGLFVEGVATVTLTANQSCTFFATGGNWFIIGGEPKREQTYSARTKVATNVSTYEVEPSATRDAMLAVTLFKNTSTTTLSAIKVGGVNLYESVLVTELYLSLRIPAGQKFRLDASLGTADVYTSTLLL